jgi:hypothetical protein
MARAAALPLLALLAAGAPLDAFLPPQQGTVALNADIVSPLNVSAIDDCATLCLATPGCIHINICQINGAAPPFRCGVGGYSRTYVVEAASTCSYYQRLLPRNDSRIHQVVEWKLSVPTGNVTLHGGPLLAAADAGIDFLLTNFPVDDLLFNFRQRAGLPQPPGAHCIGWDCTVNWVEGSLAAMFLMGAGGHLRWRENAALRAAMNELIEGARPGGCGGRATMQSVSLAVPTLIPAAAPPERRRCCRHRQLLRGWRLARGLPTGGACDGRAPGLHDVVDGELVPPGR